MPEETDDQLAARLREALAAQAASVEVTGAAERVARARVRAGRRRVPSWAPVGVAAALIVALVAGVGFAAWRNQTEVGPSGPSPSVTPEVSPAGSPRVVTLPSAYRLHTMTSDGQLAVLDEVSGASDSLAADIILADLAQGTWKVLATAAAGYRPSQPVISGGNVAWVEGRYSNPDFSGPCDWHIVVMNLSSGQTRTVASGVSSPRPNTPGEGGGTQCAPIDLDGTQLAYAVQDTAASRPLGWQIRILDLATGQVQRSVATQSEIDSLGISGGTVAYSEILVDAAGGSARPRLMLSTQYQPTPREVAPDGGGASFRQGRLAWGDGVGRIWTAVGPAWTPVPVPVAGPPASGTAPAASADQVSYTDQDTTGTASSLWLWDATGILRLVPGSDGALISGLGGGWITWAGGVGDSVTVSGMSLTWAEPPPTGTPQEVSPAPGGSFSPTGSTCQASSLAIDGVRQGESGIVNLGIAITNTGDASCTLPQLPAAVQLLDAKGTALDIPTETVTATPGPPAPPVVIAPHVAAAAILTVYWISWCHPDPGPLTVKVIFVAGAGSVSGPVGPGGPLPRCDTPGRASSLQLDGINAAS